MMPWSKELQDSWRQQQKIKDDLKDCTVCNCPSTQEEYDEYKMCPWCYSQVLLDPDVGHVI